MTGILLVSHSKQLAQGLEKLLRSLSGEDVFVESVGGVGSLGVDATMVMEGLNQLTDMGSTEILVFGDLGSAILSAENAKDLMPVSARVHVVDAPFVEGAVAAAMSLSTGGGAEEAMAAAEEAYQIRKR
ncbi:MAG: PTS mannose transporter subunit IID [Firmicutes bacterium]|jgi:dihydroxyacetone kinase DhaKLM complex PTS-EIIA-like component DhaM|nr:PTS mannose transporter subunit IID [Bacillota bacterium]MCL5013957.1 PTS mannose transporter subunit IID [Bacillota bacterium]